MHEGMVGVAVGVAVGVIVGAGVIMVGVFTTVVDEITRGVAISWSA